MEGMTTLSRSPPLYYLTLILAVIFGLAAVFAQYYKIEYYLGNWPLTGEPMIIIKYPYRDYVFPLAIASIAFFVVTAYLREREEVAKF